MILYPDALLALEYEMSTDILTVPWPNLTGAALPELEVALTKLIDAIKHYDVKRLLIDSQNSRVDIPQEIYKPVIFGLIQALTKTRLTKMARVLPEDVLRERQLRSYNAEMASKNMFTFQTGEFATRAAARHWLSEAEEFIR
ncbi:hypothetical protein AHMF7605_29050 [Adhaeribacter arboris]|uniref:STAS/SEC14 domain-containing protein n=1 Tax=Adhaeribacter arboris TaxID=2072846 RepID=A0A2T2Y8W0_9BACT|nr:hypothetical protein [Adhaeribacter arboris]PSR51959.1 hypothetical protein AHMF7605_29050 [Adhaeribacter arboris]